MARHARLRLVEDLGEVGDGEIAACQQRQDAQAAGFGRCLQRINHGIEGYWRPGQHAFAQKDIKICLCDFRAIGNRDVALGKENAAAVSSRQMMTSWFNSRLWPIRNLALYSYCMHRSCAA